MRRIWLLIIVLAVATAVVLAYTWQNIPYLNTWLINTGIISAIGGVTSSIANVVKGEMPISSVIPLVGTAGTITFAAIREAINYVKRNRAETQIKLVDAQSTVGNVKAMASDLKDTLTGANNKLKEEYATLEGEVTVLKETIGSKDEKIIEVQSELGKVQAQLIAEQDALKNTIKEMDEYRIALEQKSVPTSN